jgi:hypothetical protein
MEYLLNKELGIVELLKFVGRTEIFKYMTGEVIQLYNSKKPR